MAKPAHFDTNVFINCPFDAPYQPIFQAVVFTVLACGFTPCSSLQERDAGTIRLDKIKRLISHSRLSIHDISRTEPDAETGLPRFNMPFELGLDLGARAYGRGYLQSKEYLILDRDSYRLQKYLSDISGQDIAAHSNSVDEAVQTVRTWLNSHRPSGTPPLLGALILGDMYRNFCIALPEASRLRGLDPAHLDFNDLVYFTIRWVELNV